MGTTVVIPAQLYHIVATNLSIIWPASYLWCQLHCSRQRQLSGLNLYREFPRVLWVTRELHGDENYPSSTVMGNSTRTAWWCLPTAVLKGQCLYFSQSYFRLQTEHCAFWPHRLPVSAFSAQQIERWKNVRGTNGLRNCEWIAVFVGHLAQP